MKAVRVEPLRALALASILAVVAGCAAAPPVEVPVVSESVLAQGRHEGVVAVRDFLREHYDASRSGRAAQVSGPLAALREACRKLRGDSSGAPPSPAWEPAAQALLAALDGAEAYAKSGDDAFARAVAVCRVEDAVARLEAAMRPARAVADDERW